jgi:acyl-CoA synthetase (AMP-forming)/AMP-acid ligase II
MIVRSPLPDITIPETALTPFVLRHAERLAEKPALIDGPTGRILTYAELSDAIRRAASGLNRLGFRKGEILALCSPNLPEYAVAFHAVALLGGAVSPINPLYTADEIAQQIQDSGAAFVLTAPALAERVLQAAKGSAVRERLVFGEAPGMKPFASLLQSDGVPPEVAIHPGEDLVALPFSSGTTGVPKGVMLTHRNLVANLLQAHAMRHIAEDDVLCCVLPMFHIYGLVVLLNAGLYEGATIVTLPRFELESYLKTLQDYRVTLAHLVPPVVLALAKHPAVERHDLSALRLIFSGAAPLGAELSKSCAERLGCRIKQGYGMTEASPVTHMSPPEPENIRLGAVGVPVPSTECRIVDPATCEDRAPGEAGEIWVRGPQVMKGYLNRPDATSLTIDPDGWLHTGDIGHADPDGQFYIVDRVKELIKYKGFQVAPAELEAVLLAHPAVADAAVIGMPDDEAGEVPKAYVALKAGAASEEILEFVAGRVAPHKKIRALEVIEQIPKSPSGKILRRLLIERERGRRVASNP